MIEKKPNKVSYFSGDKKSLPQALSYSKINESAHRFLAYRDVPGIIRGYFKDDIFGKLALDYGTGAGYSANFLKNLGFNTIGVDLSAEMLEQARLKYQNIKFFQIKNGVIPIESNMCDLLFSSFVLFEISDKFELVDYLLESNRVLKKNRLFIAVTGSEFLHSINRKWISFRTDFPENAELYSGKCVKLLLKDLNIEFNDYYWTENDYSEALNKAGFKKISYNYPLGFEGETYKWEDEKYFPPFVIITAKSNE